MADRFLSTIPKLDILNNSDNLLVARGDQLQQISLTNFLENHSSDNNKTVHWNDIIGKPENLGKSSFLGTKRLTVGESSTLTYVDSNTLNGVIDWIGKDGNDFYVNPVDDKITITINNSTSSTSRLTDKIFSPVQNRGLVSSYNFVIDFKNYEISPTVLLLSIRCNNNQSTLYEIQSSSDNNNWTTLGQVTFTGTDSVKYIINLNSNAYYQYLRLQYISRTATIVWYVDELEVWGQVRTRQNINDGSLSYDLKITDINYLLIPDSSIGTINFMPLSTENLNIGDAFYLYNPHAFNIQGIPASGDILQSSNDLSYVSQGQTARLIKASETLWFAY